MQTDTIPPAAAVSLSASALSRHSLGDLLRLQLAAALAIGMRVAGVAKEWRIRAQSRDDLARMGEREWRDLGLTRGEVLHEIRKPFWSA
jgi:uncharacterized protein YjiS (DUF1127 family)